MVLCVWLIDCVLISFVSEYRVIIIVVLGYCLMMKVLMMVMFISVLMLSWLWNRVDSFFLKIDSLDNVMVIVVIFMFMSFYVSILGVKKWMFLVMIVIVSVEIS